MKHWNTSTLLDQLGANIRRVLLEAESLKSLSDARLNRQPAPGSWSPAQVLEHLNVYSRYYLPAMEKAASEAPQEAKSVFVSGWLGSYFTKVMQVDTRGLAKRKMKSPKMAVPQERLDAVAVLDEFIGHQHQLLNLLKIVGAVDMGGVRVPISIAKAIRLKLGDTLQFFVAHEVRHMEQWKRAVGTVIVTANQKAPLAEAVA
jgi:uncharacterized damage-inducible protein DinB